MNKWVLKISNKSLKAGCYVRGSVITKNCKIATKFNTQEEALKKSKELNNAFWFTHDYGHVLPVKITI